MSQIDLECGRQSEEEEDSSVYYSDIDDDDDDDDDGECSYDDQGFAPCSEILDNRDSESGKASSMSEDCSVDIESGEKKLDLGSAERDCRICQLSLLGDHGVCIELGCCCKDDMAAVHKHCADTWFRIKGNKTCEICNSIARNFVGLNDVVAVRQANVTHAAAATTPSVPVRYSTETRILCDQFFYYLLACIVFTLVISWLLHVKISS